MDQKAFAKRTGFSQAKVSRCLSGAIIPDRSDLVRLVTTVSADRSRRLELLLSFLIEEAQACHATAGFDSRHYNISAVAEDALASFGADLQLIAEQAQLHSDVADLIGDMAALIRRGLAADDRLAVMAEAQAADEEAILAADTKRRLAKLEDIRLASSSSMQSGARHK